MFEDALESDDSIKEEGRQYEAWEHFNDGSDLQYISEYKPTTDS